MTDISRQEEKGMSMMMNDKEEKRKEKRRDRMRGVIYRLGGE